jgi:hypothetical protein
MRIIYFDCFSGISGDMILGAFIDAGLNLEDMKKELEKLKLGDYRIEARRTKKCGIAGTKVDVLFREGEGFHKLDEITGLIERCSLDGEVKELSCRIFRKLAEAEASVHGTTARDFLFHEMGDLDAIVDVVGSVIGIKMLSIERIFVSSIHVGSGFVESSHGTLPLPAPATLELLKGIPVYSEGIDAELVTPTGAAIITTIASSFGRMPRMEIEKVGYGGGARDLPIPNLLRVSIGQSFEDRPEKEFGLQSDTVVIIETNIDDLNPQFYAHISEELFKAGALDVFSTSIMAKKGRPGVKLTILAPIPKVSKLSEVIFDQTTTFGLRSYRVERKKLPREVREVETKFGKVRVKIGRMGNRIKNIAPEYEDCERTARDKGIPLKEIYDTAKKVALEEFGTP